MTIFPFLIGAFGLVTTIIWLVIGWRAMKAHESLAESSERIRSELKKIAETQSTDRKIL